MRRAIRLNDSAILTQQLRYLKNNSTNNNKIADVLWQEQKGFCAYTDEYMSSRDARDVEHFNPELKYKDEDGYHNWLLVKHQTNKKKGEKWEDFQLCLHPAAADFEQRIKYLKGFGYVAVANDEEAANLVRLLQLDDRFLADDRNRFIERKRKEIEWSGLSQLEFFKDLVQDDICHVDYPRAIREEFGVDILELIA